MRGTHICGGDKNISADLTEQILLGIVIKYAVGNERGCRFGKYDCIGDCLSVDCQRKRLAHLCVGKDLFAVLTLYQGSVINTFIGSKLLKFAFIVVSDYCVGIQNVSVCAERIGDRCAILPASANGKGNVANEEQLAVLIFLHDLFIGFRVVDDQSIRPYVFI